MNASKYTYDDEKNENNDEMKRKRGLDLLGRCSVALEAPQGEAWLHGDFLQQFFTFFFFKGKENSFLGLHSFKLK